MPARPVRDNFAGMGKHFGGIDVLPPGVANVDSARFSVARHQSHPVSQTTVPLHPGLFEIIENSAGTDKQTGVDRIVSGQSFSDCDDPLSSRLDFHGVVEIEN